jgi:hypothetical protein
MRTYTTIRTMNTACGKTLTYIETTGESNKLHSTEGPAFIYPKEEKKAPEYYLYGIKYSKNKWQELINSSKVTATGEPTRLDF